MSPRSPKTATPDTAPKRRREVSSNSARKKRSRTASWPGATITAANAGTESTPLIATLDCGARLSGCTTALERLLEIRRDKLLGSPLLDLVASDDRTLCRLALQRLLAGQPAEDFVVRLLRANSEPVWTRLRPSLSPDKTAILLEGTPVPAPAHQADEAIGSLPVLNEIEEGVIVADATQPGLPVVDANAGFARLTGYSRDETLSLPMHFLADGNTDRVLLEKTIATALQGHRVSAELGFSRRDGAPLWARLTLVPFTDGTGKVNRIVAVHLDVSERRLVFDALREKNSALTEALESLQKTKGAIVQRERMHALGKMASGIVHDFNNLLAPILGFTELLLSFPPLLEDTNRVATYLQKIRTAASDGATVVSRLREFYRSPEESEETPAEFFVQKAVEETLELTRHRWRNEAQARGQEVEVIVNLQETGPVMGVAAEIRQALTNLVLNAIDAMPDGGTLALHTYPVGNWVCLKVSDTGQGMAPDTRMRCFEPFFTTKGKAGTGLGLSIVFGIVERHRGRVDLDSEPGRGTTFTIWLPVTNASSSIRGAAPNAAAEMQIPPLHVLFVDDEDLLLEVVSENLLGMGHTVDCFTDPNAALERFYKDRYDLVITDRAMPGMTGDQLAQRIREYSPTTPIVLLTGFGSIIKQSGEKPANISEVLSKPLSQQTLREVLLRYGLPKRGAA